MIACVYMASVALEGVGHYPYFRLVGGGARAPGASPASATYVFLEHNVIQIIVAAMENYQRSTSNHRTSDDINKTISIISTNIDSICKFQFLALWAINRDSLRVHME